MGGIWQGRRRWETKVRDEQGREEEEVEEAEIKKGKELEGRGRRR